MIPEKKSKFIECECGGEGMLVTHYTNDIHDKEVYLSMFSIGIYTDGRLTFRERLRHAWHVMKTGKPFDDSLILSEKDTKELGQYLLDIKFEENGEQIG
jgi:hypothetical protein